MEFNFRFESDRLEKASSDFGGILQRNKRLAMKDSSEDVGKFAQRRHRFQTRTGKLEEAVKNEVDVGPDGEPFGRTYLDLAVASYASYVHEGTKPHSILPKNKKMLRFVTSPGTAQFSKMPYSRFHVPSYSPGSSWTFAFGVKHPGTKPDKFLYEALYLRNEAINATFEKYTQKSIKEAGFNNG